MKTSTYVNVNKTILDNAKRVFKALGYTLQGGFERALIEFTEKHKKEVRDGKED